MCCVFCQVPGRSIYVVFLRVCCSIVVIAVATGEIAVWIRLLLVKVAVVVVVVVCELGYIC